MPQRTGCPSVAAPCTLAVTPPTFGVQRLTWLLFIDLLFPTDTRLIPDQHHFHTDTVTSLHFIFLVAIILKQFMEMLHSYFRLLLAC